MHYFNVPAACINFLFRRINVDKIFHQIFQLFWCWSVTRCSCHYFLAIILFHHYFHHDSCDYHWDSYGHSLLFELQFRLSVTKLFWFCKCTIPGMFAPLDILLDYLIEHVASGFRYVMFTFPTRVFFRGIPGFATDCPCGDKNDRRNDSRFVSLT